MDLALVIAMIFMRYKVFFYIFLIWEGGVRIPLIRHCYYWNHFYYENSQESITSKKCKP